MHWKENNSLKNIRICHSVVEEGHIRKLWILGKAKPKQSVVVVVAAATVVFFPIPVSYFLFGGTFLWESRLLNYLTLERSSSPPNFRENSDFTCSGLGYSADCLNQLLGIYITWDINAAFFLMFIKTVDLDNIQPLWFSSIALFLFFSKVWMISFMISSSPNSHLLFPEPQDPAVVLHAPSLLHPVQWELRLREGVFWVKGTWLWSQIRSQLCLSFIHSFLHCLLGTCYVPHPVTRGYVGYTGWPSTVSSSVQKGEMRDLLGGLVLIYIKYPVECLIHSNALQMVARATCNCAFHAVSCHCHVQLQQILLCVPSATESFLFPGFPFISN